ncbi:helix-turn-helix domain-containing protein [Streptomyces noursei]
MEGGGQASPLSRAAVRSRCDRIRPADVGLGHGPRRRVPGLRRDEVAQLAGASVDYYNELERGAGSQPSEQMIAALARALRLTADERDHLYHLADRPVPARGGPASHVHPGMLDLLSRLTSTPAQVITDLHVTLVQNPLAVALLGDHSGLRDVAFRRDDRKRLRHPALGLVEVNCLNLFSEDGRQRLLWFTPAVGTDSADLLDLLAVLGTQDVAGPTC